MCDALLSGIWFIGCFALGEIAGGVIGWYLLVLKQKYEIATKVAEAPRKRELRAR